MVKTIIFDYDGTIHNTLGIYEPAFREAYQWLSEQNVVEEQKIETAQIAGWLGLNSKEMWDTFLPELDQRYKDQASAIVGDSMVRQIRKHRAVWYPGAEEMLTALKNRGYHLVILSNCKVAYRKAHWEEFRMERWFEQFYDCESYGFCPKTEIVQEVIRDYPGPYLVIGDRRQDLECARSCKSPFIGEKETWDLGFSLGEKACAGQVYTLVGDLGVGKTIFTKGLAKGLGIDEPVSSPTFTIVQIYDEGRLP